MKHLTALVIVCILVFPTLYAQQEPAKLPFVVGGSVGFGFQKNLSSMSDLGILHVPIIFSGNQAASTGRNISFSPYLAKQFSRHWLWGVQAEIQSAGYRESSHFDNNYHNRLASNLAGIGLFSRYTINPGSILGVYLQPNAGFSLVQQAFYSNSIEAYKENGWQAGIGVNTGLLFNINDKWRLTMGFGGINFLTGHWKQKDSDNSGNFSKLNADFSPAHFKLGVEMKF